MSAPAVTALQTTLIERTAQTTAKHSSSWYGRFVTWIIEVSTLEVCKIIIIILKFLGYSEDTLRFFRYVENVEETITQEIHHFGTWPDAYPEDPSRLVGKDPKIIIIAYAIEDLLRSVNCSISSLTEETRGIIKQIGTRYDSLNLHGSQLTVENIEELINSFPDLEKLYLTHCNIDFHHLQELLKLKSLSHLSLEGIVTITDHLIPLFNQFESLTSLNLSGCHGILKSESLVQLEKIKKLEIGTSACLFGNGAREVAKLSQLTSLNLRGSDHISDGSVQELIPLSNLRTLNLSGTKITDGVFHHLLQFTSLRKVIIKDCAGITYEGFTHFMRQKPSLLKVIAS